MLKHQNLFLVGLMGSGKTDIGRYLAEKLNLSFYDTDEEIEKAAKMDIPSLFSKEGEQNFRQREKEIIEKLTKLHGIVLATGGGAVMDAINRDLLKKNGTIIYLQASIDTLVKRTQHKRNRPLLFGKDPYQLFKQLQTQRETWYREIADLTINTDDLMVATVGHKILHQLEI